MISAKPLVEETEKNLLAESGGVAPMKTHWLLFFLLGNVSLLAFNIIINAVDIYSKVTGKADIGTILNRAYNIPCSIMALILCFYKPRNLKIALLSVMGALTAILCTLPIIIIVNINANVAYWLTICLVGLVGIGSSMVFSNSYSLASQFGPIAAATVSSGNGCCGVVASALRIITKAIFNKESQIVNSSAAYFFLAALIIFLTLFYMIHELKDPDVATKINFPPESTSIFNQDTLTTIKVIWPLWLGEFCNFMITLSIFPGYVCQVPQDSKMKSWTTVLVTTIFTIFDWVGRYLPGKFVWPSQKFAWAPIILRTVFYAIFLLSLQDVMHVSEPAWTLSWMVVFALTNGYFGTVAMIHGSNHTSLSISQRRFAGLLMPFAINSGILTAMGLTFLIPTPKRK